MEGRKQGRRGREGREGRKQSKTKCDDHNNMGTLHLNGHTNSTHQLCPEAVVQTKSGGRRESDDKPSRHSQ